VFLRRFFNCRFGGSLSNACGVALAVLFAEASKHNAQKKQLPTAEFYINFFSATS